MITVEQREQHHYLTHQRRNTCTFLYLSYPHKTFLPQERILRRSDFSERWNSSARLSRRESLQGGAQHQTCFMSDTHEPTTRLANGLSSSIWTSINCTFVFLVRENDFYSERPDNPSFIFSPQHLLHVFFFFLSLFYYSIVYQQNM